MIQEEISCEENKFDQYEKELSKESKVTKEETVTKAYG